MTRYHRPVNKTNKGIRGGIGTGAVRGAAGKGDRPVSGGRQVTQTPQGVTAMVVAEVVYGFFPLYWAALANVSSMNVMLYRIVTAAVVMVLFMLATRRWPRFVAAVKALWARPKVFAAAVAAAVLVTIDWGRLHLPGVDRAHLRGQCGELPDAADQHAAGVGVPAGADERGWASSPCWWRWPAACCT